MMEPTAWNSFLAQQQYYNQGGYLFYNQNGIHGQEAPPPPQGMTRQNLGAIGFGRPLRSMTRSTPHSSVVQTPAKVLIGSRIGGLRRTLQDAFPTPPLHDSPFPISTRPKYSRKVFVGGLPPDIDESEIRASFSRFGKVVVDWPHKDQTKAYFPPKGYAFLIFERESSVHQLMTNTTIEEDKHFIKISSHNFHNRSVQIRPWELTDTDYFTDGGINMDARLTVFVGGVPRPLKAVELGGMLEVLFGGVCYAGVDTDRDLQYPKGAGRVTFNNHYSYMAAISTRFLQLKNKDVDKGVEIKPYVFDDQPCDSCGIPGPFFCPSMSCLKGSLLHCVTTDSETKGGKISLFLVAEMSERESLGAAMNE